MKKLLTLVLLTCSPAITCAQNKVEWHDISPKITSNTKIVYLDRKDPYGSMIVNARRFVNGTAIYQDPLSKLWGAIDTLGNVIVKPTFKTWSYYFNDGVAIVRAQDNEKGYWLIDKQGNTISKLPNVFKISAFNDGYATVAYETNGQQKIGYIDTKGKFVFPSLTREYTSGGSEMSCRMFPFSGGLSIFYNSVKKKWGGFDKSGKIVIPSNYDALGYPTDGYIYAIKDGKSGVINTKNEVIIPFQYDKFVSWGFNKEDLLVVYKSEKAGCINKTMW